MHSKTNEILCRIREMIQAGEFSSSGFLPPERDLCAQLRLSRVTLRMICEKLVEEGLLRRIPGKGLKVLSVFERSKQRKVLLVLPSNAIKAAEISRVLQGVASAAEENNAELVLFFQNALAECTRLIARIQENPWDGIVFIEDFPSGVLETLKARKCRFCVANFENNASLPVCRVDFRAVGRMAGKHLLGKGCRQIGFIGGGRQSFHYRELLAGLKGALAEEDLALDGNLIFQFDNQEDKRNLTLLKKALAKFRKAGCAFFVGRDHWGRLLYKACQGLELRIPEDVAVLGYDGFSWDEASANGLSTILQPAFETGQAAFAMIAQEGPMAEEADALVLIPPKQLVERSSTDIPQ